MPRPKRKHTVPEKPLPDDRMHALLEEHLVWMLAQNYSEDTVVTRRTTIGYFIDWCRERGLEEPAEITRPILERYQRWLFQYRKHDGEALTFRTQALRLRAIKGWFRWMARQNYLLHNPASELLLPRFEHRLPKYVLSADEAERVLSQPDTTNSSGLRDRAILETFYATGMRRMEVARLKLHDLDADRGTVMVRMGKGKKDRHIPIGERAQAWITKYVEQARPGLATGSDDGTVFLTDLGNPFERSYLTQLVRRYVDKSQIGKRGGCHLFRHTVATLMLENGADVRVIQELLGHAKITTTEMYTRVSINLLKQVYATTHPSAKLKRAKAAESASQAEEHAGLMETLAAEAEEEGEDV